MDREFERFGIEFSMAASQSAEDIRSLHSGEHQIDLY